nr:MAG TPA: hypothetical protein [Crassvirales sp.]
MKARWFDNETSLLRYSIAERGLVATSNKN